MDSDFDILSDVLGSLRICGSLLLHESYAPPWGISIPDMETLGRLLEVPAGTKVVAFHLVERGYIEITAQSEDESTGLGALSLGGGGGRNGQFALAGRPIGSPKE